MAMVLTLPLAAQKKTTATRQSKQRTTAKTTTKRKSQATTTRRKAKTKASASKNAKPTTIKGLRNERAAVQRRIRQQEQALRANKANVSKRLKDLMLINSEIGEKQKSIDGIQKDITALDDNIGILKSQLATLQSQLDDRRQRYIKSIRYMARHRSVQDKMMFVFSAQSFAQMSRNTPRTRRCRAICSRSSSSRSTKSISSWRKPADTSTSSSVAMCKPAPSSRASRASSRIS